MIVPHFNKLVSKLGLKKACFKDISTQSKERKLDLKLRNFRPFLIVILKILKLFHNKNSSNVLCSIPLSNKT